MRKAFLIVILLLCVSVVAAGAVWLVGSGVFDKEASEEMFIDASFDMDDTEDTATEPAVSVIADGLEIPWDLAFLPGDEGLLVTERGGRVVHVESGQAFPVEGVAHVGEGGLLGIALHPNFAANRFVYLYQTTETSAGLRNRVVRYRYGDDALSFDRVILDNIPGASTHDGGRIEFGPDGLLYITTGDAGASGNAQDLASLAGKVLRIRDDGSIPPDNPFGTAVYSFGHRNPQGLAWDQEGRLWATEHGRSGLQSGFDEVNRIEPGANYGWPESQGDDVAEGTVGPALHSGARDTWAPASAAFRAYEGVGPSGSLFFGGLRGEALYEALLSGPDVIGLKTHFTGEFGRIRTVRVGPDGYLYLTTSNRDGRGRPAADDDTIIRINPASLE